MKPGDMIFIPEKAITNFRKYVPYSLGLYATPTPACSSEFAGSCKSHASDNFLTLQLEGESQYE